jgi:hypothetical protein
VGTAHGHNLKQSPTPFDAHLRAGKTYGKPIFGVGFDLIKNLRENLSKTYLRTNVQSHFFDGVVGVFLVLVSLHANMPP